MIKTTSLMKSTQMESPGTRSLVLFPAVLIQPFSANVKSAKVGKSEGYFALARAKIGQ